MAKAKKKPTTTKKKATTSKKKAAPKPVEMLLVGSKVRAEIKDKGCNTAGDALDGLNGWVHWLIGQATQRASANNRKTVRAHDFMLLQS